MTSGDVETANEFNKAFQSVFVVEGGFNSDYSNSSYSGSVITHIEVDEGIVKKLLDEMNEYKAVGPDGISTKFLKECS